ncbi:hypothetical protein SS50377_26237 [Spironucleus salmonicida]|uniref:Uncharacterized protein n=2 Tax=Spironucleus salmonicida TaxID=348837 RepID=A0A9P8LPN4_9EUKA|nr:hypothetical protein SS50377_26237 [Spironucleus salmonicida]
MGCGSQHEAASDMQKADSQTEQAPKVTHLEYVADEDGKSRYSNSSVDFSCQYRPEEFAVAFLEIVDYKPETRITFQKFRQLMLQQYSFLFPKDIDSMFRFLYYNKIQDYKQAFPDSKFDEISLSCLQFIKIGYIFYRFHDVLRDPRRALFYFLDDGFNLHVDYKNLKKLLRLHYNIDAKNAITLFKVISAKHGFINLKKFNALLEYFDKACLTDDLVFLFQEERDEAHMPLDFDKELDKEVEVFSDISTRKQELAKQAEDGIRKQKLKEEERRKRKQIENQLMI